jgi:competence protein ComEC
MKVPAIWMVTAFAAGLLLARPAILPQGGARRTAIFLLAGLALVAISAGLILLRKHLVRIAAVASLLAWILAGALAGLLAQLPLPANHVTALLSSGLLDTNQPLRWRARLREDPKRLPWGHQYDLDLETVEIGGQSVAVEGGLRLSYFHSAGEDEPVVLRAGDRAEMIVASRPPHNFKDPGAFDRRAFLARQNIHVLGTLRHAELLTKLDTPPLTLGHRAARARGQLLEQLDSLFPAQPAALAVLRAMLLGDRGFISRDAAVAFQQTGAYHVLAIAGLHVAALVGFLLWAGKHARLPLFAATLLTLAILACYVAVVEDRPPIFRAALMALIVLVARLFFRRVELLNTAVLAALLLLIARPMELYDSSFQLSFLAVGTIGGLALPWLERTAEPYRRALAQLGDASRDAGHTPRAAQFRLDVRAAANWLSLRLPARLGSRGATLVTVPLRAGFFVWELFVLSVVLQIGMLPLMALDFHRISLIGPLANIPAVLLTGLIIPTGFVTLTVSFLWHGLGRVIALALGGMTALLVRCTAWAAHFPHASYRIPIPPGWLLAAFFAGLCALAVALRAARRKTVTMAALTVAFCAGLFATFPFSPRLTRGALEVTALDVGQGDSLFLAFPGGRTMLLDGGGTPGGERFGDMRAGLDIGEEVVSPYLWTRGIQQLDVVALTHAHQDHLGGLHAILENFRVGALWISRDVESPALTALEELAHVKGIPIIHEHSGENFTWDGVRGHVLWPQVSDSEDASQAKNNDSLVIRLEFANEALLLPGDIERQAEHDLISSGEPLKADFLKVAHHGSKTSTTEEFLERVAPRVAVISAGEANPYGHPHPEVVARLGAAGVRVLRTDRDGAVTVSTDGKSLHVSCFVACP